MAASLSGCTFSAEILTSVIHQRAGIDFKTYSSGNWTFEGLDTRIQPRVRSGFYSTTVSGTPFPDPNNLGDHSYCRNKSEKTGVVYTCNAGHIDIGHVRKTADWTGFLSARTLEQIEKGNSEFRFKLYEPSIYYVTLTYPENWEKYSEDEKESIAKKVSIKLGMYFVYNAGIWHEIMTWFDYKPKMLLSDFASAFAWEDIYSNLLGILLAEKALRSDRSDFCSSIKLYLDQTLRELEVQSREIALLATNKVKGKLYSKKYFFPVIKKRNLDIGLDDGLITPCPVPGMPICENNEVKSLAIPDLDSISKYGFAVKLEIEPREWEKNKILKILYPKKKNRKKRLEPNIHFPVIMNHIKSDAINRGNIILEDTK
jgi:hypothetical protein